MNLKELKYVIIGEDRLSDKFKRITNSSNSAINQLNKNTTNFGKFRTNLTEVSSQVPGIGSAIGMAAGPIGWVAAGVGALCKGIGSAIDAAKDFNKEFRQLQNLNLDKSDSQIKTLKNSITNLSFEEGFDPTKVSTAMFDVQSLTGKYGDEVENIVTKVGKFSQVMQSDFNETITGTAKAMNNFGFGEDKLDAYMASLFKTVQTAKITYNELSKVSAVYAGSASSAGQSFDSANKLMALFTVKTKNAEEASTLVKSAFTDLFKESTINQFKKVGISLFDIKGNAKQVDVIMKELNAKFMNAKTSQEMTKLKNIFAGSEGLRTLIEVSSDKSGAMLNTLGSFDDAVYDYDKALKNANNDLNYQNEIVSNKLKTSWTKFGDALTPIFIKIKEGLSWALEKASEGLNLFLNTMKNGIKGNFYNMAMDKADVNAKDIREQYDKAYEKYKNVPGIKNKLYNSAYNEFVRVSAELKTQKPGVDTDYTMKGLRNYQTIMNKFKSNGTTTTPDNTSTSSTTGTTSGGSLDLKKGMDGISGGGTQMKSVIVTIQKLVETLQVNSTTITEGASQIKQIIEETLIRSVQGMEQSIG